MEAGIRATASDARRNAILAAALPLFVKKGYAGTGIGDIRRASGASVGSIYHHFGGKEGVAAALYAGALRDYQEGVLALIRAEPSAQEGIEKLVRHHVGWVTRHPDRARYLLGMRDAEVLLASAREVRAMNRAFFRELYVWLDSQADRGSIQRLPRDLVFPLAIGPSQELARNWLEGHAKTSPEEAAAVLSEAAWNALRARRKR
jgi:AcrR family transcriptional regulator